MRSGKQDETAIVTREPTLRLDCHPQAVHYQAWYDAFSVIGGGIVPVLINVQPNWKVVGIDVIQLTVTVISLLVVVFVSLESVFHYREQWKNYRSTEQSLGHERFLFLSGVGRYAGLDSGKAFSLFVERVEDAIAKENSATLSVMTMAAEASDPSNKPKANETA